MAAIQHPGDQHEIPRYEAHESAASLKDRIKQHYEIASDYYYSLWGQHIHHGLFRGDPRETKEEAQVNLIRYLLEISRLPRGARVLDVGCGIGGTSRFLAREHGCAVTGITISGRQVDIAKKLTLEDKAAPQPALLSDRNQKDGEADAEKGSDFSSSDDHYWLSYAGAGNGNGNGDGITKGGENGAGAGAGAGAVRFLELDAEKMMEYFSSPPSPTADSNKNKRDDGPPFFDCVWISEALSHLPNKPLFFSSSFSVLAAAGSSSSSRLVIADWFKAPDLTPEQVAEDIKPIEDGMLLPRLYTADEYVRMAEEAGFRTLQAPVDISAEVAKTWDISWSLVSSPALWAFAISQGRDGLSFLQAFRAMRRGYANGTFRYAVMCFEKP